jgi:hypothetical protein
MIEFERYRSDNYELNRVQGKVEDFARNVQTGGIINGRLIPDLSFVANKTYQVYHGLGRRYKGYIVVSTTSANVVVVKESESNSPEEYIPLQSAANSTISLWVF